MNKQRKTKCIHSEQVIEELKYFPLIIILKKQGADVQSNYDNNSLPQQQGSLDDTHFNLN